MKRTRLAPAPEPDYPNLIPDGRDLGPEIVFLPPATRGRHPPPETYTLGQHVVLSLPRCSYVVTRSRPYPLKV
jgi:hypothetical protein